MSAIKKTFAYGQHQVTLETGEIARQADGAVVVSMGDTVVLVTAVARKDADPNKDFFPLTVNYVEKTYAAGRIPGGFFKREGRPSEKETLTSRLIDRPIRPLFPEGFFNEVQVVATVISLNPEIDADIPAMLGASAALALSGVPFMGPIGGAKVGYMDGQYILNPTRAQLKDSELDLVVAGTAEGVLMVESEADSLSEDVMLGAVVFGHEQMQIAIKAINELQAQAGKPSWNWQPAAANSALESALASQAEAALSDAYKITEKQARRGRLQEIRESAAVALCGGEAPAFTADAVSKEFGNLEYRIVRRRVIAGEPRIDGRDMKTVRPINIRTGVLPRTHGSALFTRGETQALVVTTLGTGPRRADHRRSRRRAQRAVHASLQLPALQRGRDGHDGLSEASRDRTRQPGSPRHLRRHAGHDDVPVRHPRRLRDSRIQWLELDGERVRHEPRTDGCGRADQGGGCWRRDGPRERGRSLPGAHGHPRR